MCGVAMNIRDLKYLVAIADHCHFGLAASACFVSQPAPKPSRVIGIVWRPSSAKKILLENMVGQIRKFMSKQNAVRVINTPILCHKVPK